MSDVQRYPINLCLMDEWDIVGVLSKNLSFPILFLCKRDVRFYVKKLQCLPDCYFERLKAYLYELDYVRRDEEYKKGIL